VSEVSTRGGSSDGRSAAEIEADIVRTRRQLAATLDELAVRVHPSTIAAEAKASVAAAVDRTAGRAYVSATRVVDRVRSQFVNEKGEPRPERILPAAAVVVAVVVGASLVRRRNK
jgi:hypothetical protein